MAELIYNRVTISFPDNDETAITESNILSESLSVRQSVCDSSELRFGGCIASQFRVDLLNTEDRQFSAQLTGKWISVKISQLCATDNVLYPRADRYPSATLFLGRLNQTYDYYVFSGFIDSAKLSKTDKNVRTIIAYDIFAKMYEWDATDYLMAAWKVERDEYLPDLNTLYNKCLYHNGHIDIAAILNPDRTNNLYAYAQLGSMTIGSFQPNNSDWLADSKKISYGELLRCICEMIASFGFIVPDEGKGKFEMRSLKPGTDYTYPFYESLVAEEYQASGYTKIDLPARLTGNRDKKTSVFTLVRAENTGNVDKTYDATENVLAWRYLGSGQSDFAIDVAKYYNSIVGDCLALNSSGAKYTRFTPLKAKVEANLSLKPAAPVKLLVNQTNPDGSYVIVDGEIQKEELCTYILTRTLTGVQALTDEIEAKGMM